MKHIAPLFALAAAGVIVASAGASAAQVDTTRPSYVEAALVGPAPGIGSLDSQRDVIEPPSSIDPGMSIDPPQTGAKTPVVHPPGAMPGNRLILPH
jgi:hypothetical protein